jgi:hypothetical protein
LQKVHPDFSQGYTLSNTDELEEVRDKHADAMDWFCSTFTRSQVTSTLMSTGVCTAIIHSWYCFGAEVVTEVWNGYLTGVVTSTSYQGLVDLARDSLKKDKENPGGWKGQKHYYNRAVYAFMAAVEKEGLHTQKWLRGAEYSFTEGKLPAVTSVSTTRVKLVDGCTMSEALRKVIGKMQGHFTLNDVMESLKNSGFVLAFQKGASKKVSDSIGHLVARGEMERIDKGLFCCV